MGSPAMRQIYDSPQFQISYDDETQLVSVEAEGDCRVVHVSRVLEAKPTPLAQVAQPKPAQPQKKP